MVEMITEAAMLSDESAAFPCCGPRCCARALAIAERAELLACEMDEGSLADLGGPEAQLPFIGPYWTHLPSAALNSEPWAGVTMAPGTIRSWIGMLVVETAKIRRAYFPQ